MGRCVMVEFRTPTLLSQMSCWFGKGGNIEIGGVKMYFSISDEDIYVGWSGGNCEGKIIPLAGEMFCEFFDNIAEEFVCESFFSHRENIREPPRQNGNEVRIQSQYLYCRRYKSLNCAIMCFYDKRHRNDVLRSIGNNVGIVICGVCIDVRPSVSKRSGKEYPKDIFTAWGWRTKVPFNLRFDVELCQYFDSLVQQIVSAPPRPLCLEEALNLQ